MCNERKRNTNSVRLRDMIRSQLVRAAAAVLAVTMMRWKDSVRGVVVRRLREGNLIAENIRSSDDCG